MFCLPRVGCTLPPCAELIMVANHSHISSNTAGIHSTCFQRKAILNFSPVLSLCLSSSCPQALFQSSARCDSLARLGEPFTQAETQSNGHCSSRKHRSRCKSIEIKALRKGPASFFVFVLFLFYGMKRITQTE